MPLSTTVSLKYTYSSIIPCVNCSLSLGLWMLLWKTWLVVLALVNARYFINLTIQIVIAFANLELVMFMGYGLPAGVTRGNYCNYFTLR